jgi:hypothetical protein
LGRAARERATVTAASPAVVEQWRSVYLGMAA